MQILLGRSSRTGTKCRVSDGLRVFHQRDAFLACFDAWKSPIAGKKRLWQFPESDSSPMAVDKGSRHVTK